MAKKTKKCEKCNDADATVWFAAVSGNGRVSKHRYCKECAIVNETIRKPPQVMQPMTGQQTLIEMMKSSLAGNSDGQKTETTEVKIKKLNASMKKAIEKEDYESAAKIRDEIAAIQKENGETI